MKNVENFFESERQKMAGSLIGRGLRYTEEENDWIAVESLGNGKVNLISIISGPLSEPLVAFKDDRYDDCGPFGYLCQYDGKNYRFIEPRFNCSDKSENQPPKCRFNCSAAFKNGYCTFDGLYIFINNGDVLMAKNISLKQNEILSQENYWPFSCLISYPWRDGRIQWLNPKTKWVFNPLVKDLLH